ncbi:hypothetical protein P4I92_20320 [Bacillus cereus]
MGNVDLQRKCILVTSGVTSIGGLVKGIHMNANYNFNYRNNIDEEKTKEPTQ